MNRCTPDTSENINILVTPDCMDANPRVLPVLGEDPEPAANLDDDT